MCRNTWIYDKRPPNLYVLKQIIGDFCDVFRVKKNFLTTNVEVYRTGQIYSSYFSNYHYFRLCTLLELTTAKLIEHSFSYHAQLNGKMSTLFKSVYNQQIHHHNHGGDGSVPVKNKKASQMVYANPVAPKMKVMKYLFLKTF